MRILLHNALDDKILPHPTMQRCLKENTPEFQIDMHKILNLGLSNVYYLLARVSATLVRLGRKEENAWREI